MNTLGNEITSADSTTHSNCHYEAVRYNAMTHGILSKHAVLPHEDKTEFECLLAALTVEHQPAGVTEQHLVEELATILWRKRRVRNIRPRRRVWQHSSSINCDQFACKCKKKPGITKKSKRKRWAKDLKHSN